MRHNKLRLFVHMVWTTKNRDPLITIGIESSIYRCIASVAEELHCPIIAIGGIEDHVHVLLNLHNTVSVAELARRLKGSSSHLAASLIEPTAGFVWSDSYGAFTVGEKEVPHIKKYVMNQKSHHSDRQLLSMYEVAFEPDQP